MKNTGIIRRIDDLGRITIPREIRRTLNIKEDDPFELFVTDEMVCFQKYYVEKGYKEKIEGLIANLADEIDFENAKDIQSKLKEALALLRSEEETK